MKFLLFLVVAFCAHQEYDFTKYDYTTLIALGFMLLLTEIEDGANRIAKAIEENK